MSNFISVKDIDDVYKLFLKFDAIRDEPPPSGFVERATAMMKHAKIQCKKYEQELEKLMSRTKTDSNNLGFEWLRNCSSYECPICYESINLKKLTVTKNVSCFGCGPKYGHIFHTECLETSERCPLCRMRGPKRSLSHEMIEINDTLSKLTREITKGGFREDIKNEVIKKIPTKPSIETLEIYSLLSKYNEYVNKVKKNREKYRILLAHADPKTFERLQERKQLLLGKIKTILSGNVTRALKILIHIQLRIKPSRKSNRTILNFENASWYYARCRSCYVEKMLKQYVWEYNKKKKKYSYTLKDVVRYEYQNTENGMCPKCGFSNFSKMPINLDPNILCLYNFTNKKKQKKYKNVFDYTYILG